jgi:hypothetical protein
MSFQKLFDFESALAEYTGAPYVVLTDGCTHALELCFRHAKTPHTRFSAYTYISVPMLMHHLDIQFEMTNQGHSNLQVLQAASVVLKKDIAYLHGPKRSGDPAQLVADPTRFMTASSWQPKFGLNDIIQHAWSWYNK